MIQQVVVPDSLDAATAALALADRQLIAGGTIVMPAMMAGAMRPTVLVSLRRLGLATITVTPDMITVGAGATLTALEGLPELAFLRPALDKIASPSIRNMATVGGNLFARTPYGDLASCLIALDAHAGVVGPAGHGSVAVEDIVRKPPDAASIVAAVAFAPPRAGTFRFLKSSRKALNSAAIVTVAAIVAVEAGVVRSCRIALGGVAPSPVRARTVEAALTGQPFDIVHVDRAALAVDADIAPESDAYASAWYRRRVAPVHIRRALLGG